MAISSTTNRVAYTGNGVTTAFSFPYKFLENADLKVYLDGVIETLTTDYTVTGAGEDAGGTVTFLAAPASGEEVVILRDPAITQGLDLVENDPLPAEDVENAFDKLTMICQRLQDQVDRTLGIDDSVTSAIDVIIPTPDARKALIWNADADGLINSTYDPDEQATLAAASALAASSSESTASAAASAAGLAQTAAEAAQTAAEAAAATIPAYDSLTGEALNYVRLNAGETAMEFRTPAEVLSDIGAQAYVAPGTSGNVLTSNGSAWTSAAPTAAGGGAFKNKIIGGDFTTNPWQRGTSFTGLSDYGPDRFICVNGTDGVFNVIKTADAPTADQAGVFTQHCLHVDVTTADASIAAGQIAYVSQRIEGLNAAQFGFGQAGTRYVTLSFWHKHTKAGTYTVGLQNSAGNRSYVAEYTQNLSDTWERETITILVDTTGTWLYDNGVGLRVAWTLACGTTYNTTAGSWAAGDFRSTPNQVNALDSTANNFKIALVQLEAGSTATPFEHRPIGTELALCQRYLPVIGTGNTGVANSSFLTCGINSAANGGIAVARFPVQTRVAPTSVSAVGGGAVVPGSYSVWMTDGNLKTLNALAFYSASTDGCTLTWSAASSTNLVAGGGSSIASNNVGLQFNGCEL